MALGSKILSVLLSIVFFGSGCLHLLIHSCGRYSCEEEESQSLFTLGDCRELPAPQFQVSSEGYAPLLNIFCPICAGMLNSICPGESVRVVHLFPEEVYCAVPDHPGSFIVCHLPHSRAPPLS